MVLSHMKDDEARLAERELVSERLIELRKACAKHLNQFYWKYQPKVDMEFWEAHGWLVCIRLPHLMYTTQSYLVSDPSKACDLAAEEALGAMECLGEDADLCV